MLEVNWIDLELAFRDATEGIHYFDKKTGEILSFTDEEEDTDLLEEIKNSISKTDHTQRYLKITAIGTKFSRQTMANFINQIASPKKKMDLLHVFNEHGGYSRTLKKLKLENTEILNYQRFEQRALWEHIEAFLKQNNVQNTSEAPSLQLF